MDNLLPQILDLFHGLCAIPHPSGGEDAITRHIFRLLTGFGLDPEVDGANNLRCLLPGTAGGPGVIIQAHTDMVCVCTADTCYRPESDPVRTRREGDWLHSDGRTTLGADNGIGVAVMLWLAQHRNRFPHGPITLLFTACEEAGLVGAKAVDGRWLSNCRYYVNLDAFRGDAVIFASAGGLRQKWGRPLALQSPKGSHAFQMTLSGLTGGHSGFDIHRHRGNAIALLLELVTAEELEVADFSGGTNFNAIPNQARATVVTHDPEGFCARMEEQRTQMKYRLRETDPGLTLRVEPCPLPGQVWSGETLRATADFFFRLPRGVMAMREDLPDTVANSGNPALIGVEEGRVTLCHFARCAAQTTLAQVEEETTRLARQLGFTGQEVYRYSAWEGNSDNALTLRLPQLERVALHVGLECSVLLEKAPALTGIALGFDIEDAHAVTERVRLGSIPVTVQRILALLDGISKEESL